jgi:hypothetical protein
MYAPRFAATRRVPLGNGMSPEATTVVLMGILALDIALAFLYLRRHRRMIDPFD